METNDVTRETVADQNRLSDRGTSNRQHELMGDGGSDESISLNDIDSQRERIGSPVRNPGETDAEATGETAAADAAAETAAHAGSSGGEDGSDEGLGVDHGDEDDEDSGDDNDYTSDDNGEGDYDICYSDDLRDSSDTELTDDSFDELSSDEPLGEGEGEEEEEEDTDGEVSTSVVYSEDPSTELLRNRTSVPGINDTKKLKLPGGHGVGDLGAGKGCGTAGDEEPYNYNVERSEGDSIVMLDCKQGYKVIPQMRKKPPNAGVYNVLNKLRRRETHRGGHYAFGRNSYRDRFRNFRLQYELDTHDLDAGTRYKLAFLRRRAKIIEIVAWQDVIFGLTATGVCAAFDRCTRRRLCYLNVTPDEVIRSLFYNKTNNSLITVSVYRYDNFSSLKCRSTPMMYIRRGRPSAGFPLFESESLRWPGFVEFDDVNGKVLTYSAADRIYKIWDLVNYNMLYQISDHLIQEIKISPGIMLLVYSKPPKDEEGRTKKSSGDSGAEGGNGTPSPSSLSITGEEEKWEMIGASGEKKGASDEKGNKQKGEEAGTSRRYDDYVPLKIVCIDTGETLKAFHHGLVEGKDIDFIEQFNEKLLVKQKGENLRIVDVKVGTEREVSETKFVTPSAFIFLYENQLFLTFTRSQVSVWNFRGELVTKFEDHDLWHPDCNTNNIYITTHQDLIISYCRSNDRWHYPRRNKKRSRSMLPLDAGTEQSRRSQGTINISDIFTGKCLGKLCREEEEEEEDDDDEYEEEEFSESTYEEEDSEDEEEGAGEKSENVTEQNSQVDNTHKLIQRAKKRARKANQCIKMYKRFTKGVREKTQQRRKRKREQRRRIRKMRVPPAVGPGKEYALEDITALFYNEERNEIYTGRADGRIHIWHN